MDKIIKKLSDKAKTKEITKTILSICAVGGLTLLAAGGTRSSKKAGKAIDTLSQYSSSRINWCLKRLKMQDYIKYDAKDLTQPIYITKKGLERISLLSFKDKLKFLSIKKWDHLWRLVTFDISENRKKTRDNFRNKLKLLNFYKLQKNIFITPFAIEKEIEGIARNYHLQNRILILQVASLGKYEDDVKNYFFNSGKR
jgi:DNA-binding transcriptional regulator PaaX